MDTIITATRYHDISCGHRVVGHGGKCVGLHGHNYRIHFTVQSPSLDDMGMVVDFGVIKDRLCQWLEEHWDHKMLLWEKDPVLALFRQEALNEASSEYPSKAQRWEPILSSIYVVRFNPTAENMANWLLAELGPAALGNIPHVQLIKVTVEETRKCSASAERS
jgi:6-pyruvoyltetrahydropterin/6-carboxytetrahydropterin synthase